MLSDTTAWYMEKLGYRISSLGNENFRVICNKDGIPLGFLKKDQTIQMVEEEKDEEKALGEIVGFVKEYGDLRKVGNTEFEIGMYNGVSITAFYDIEKRAVQFAVYDNGNGQTELYDSRQKAEGAFVAAAGLAKASPHVPLRVWIGRKLLKGWGSDG